MHAWLLKIGEPLPIDGSRDRPYRTGILARALAERGHRVTWWSSTFDHFSKSFLREHDTHVQVDDLRELMLLHAGGYRRNISLARWQHHRQVAERFTDLAGKQPRPDVIVCALPILELCVAAVEYGQKYNVPVLLDVRDLWPDLFLDLVPRFTHPLARIALSKLYAQVRQATAGATAITGNTEAFVDWALAYAERPRGPLDRSFGMAYPQSTPEPAEIEEGYAFWREQGITGDEQFVACFFGAVGHNFEIETVVRAARTLAAEMPSIRFVLCGAGPQLAHFRRRTSDLPQVLLPGWVSAARIWTLMRLSSIGLAPYVDKKCFTLNLPNKPAEYLSAGLPIVSSLQGVCAGMLAEHECGDTYANHNAQELAACIRHYARDPLARERASLRAKRLYEAKFTADQVYEKYCIHLEHMAGHAPLRQAA